MKKWRIGGMIRTVMSMLAMLCIGFAFGAAAETPQANSGTNGETPRATMPFVFGVAESIPEQEVVSIKAELSQRLNVDQQVRTDPSRHGSMRQVDTENTAWLKRETGKWGWIDAARFGVTAANAAFLIVQHSGDLPLMTAALPEIEKDVKARRLPDGQGYALLYDRLQLMLGHKQRYGSQIAGNANGEYVLVPLEDPAKVDEYRREMGMQPLADYLGVFQRHGTKVKMDGDASHASLDQHSLMQDVLAAFESKNYPEAIRLLESALKRTPDPSIEYNLACAYALSSRKADALTHLGIAVDHGFSDTAQMSQDQDLASLRAAPEYAAILKQAKANEASQKKAAAAIPDPKAIFHEAKGSGADQKKPLLIFLHGMGGSPKQAEGTFLPLVESGRCSILLPCGSVKLGLNQHGKAGYTWDAQRDVATILDEIGKLQGVDPRRVYLAGFSAGGSMSYLVGLRNSEVFAGVIVFGGALSQGVLTQPENKHDGKRIPFFIVHGNQDPIMPFTLARQAEKNLKEKGYPVALHAFEGGHSLPQDYLEVIKGAMAWFHEAR